ncbi:MaoC/PaaZ C-terminal domain-containing protein [Actinokineospora pegani]|uniref:MaoC/PaaZ C-terminal domain-containing protein n=1 Tax=Actinokineospora pegani TaxID=2654637 RepID=UPI0012EA347D|nr:MaoC/PaaZ C-terminal domain-containing protein [Actinokineospora pegani]
MPEFTTAGLGAWTEPHPFAVTAERLAQYAEATNDPIKAHREGEVAAPVFAIAPVFQTLGPAVFGVVPLELVPRLVHGEHDFHFHRPIRPGDSLVSRSRPVGVVSREKGTTVVVRSETRDGDGELVNEQWMTAYFRGVDGGLTAGEPAPPHAFDDDGDPLETVTARIDEDQTFRYGPAAGDPMPIHLDADFARQVGLPGIIVHGMCTLAFASWAVLTRFAADDVTRLARLAVRFAKPVLPGAEITTAVHAGGAFQTTAGGALVLKDGLAVLR